MNVAVAEHPTSAWTVQQHRNTFPNEESPSYLLHDRDRAFAENRRHPRGHADPGRTSPEILSAVNTLRLLIPFAADERKMAVDRLVVTDVSADVVRRFLRLCLANTASGTIRLTLAQ